MLSYNKANIGSWKVYQLLNEQDESNDNIGFTQRDTQSLNQRLWFMHLCLLKILGESIRWTFHFIMTMRLMMKENLTDGDCRKNYPLFGDVVSFDTVYKQISIVWSSHHSLA